MKRSLVSLEKKLSLLRSRGEKGGVFLRTANELSMRLRDSNNARATSLAEEVLQTVETDADNSLSFHALRALLNLGYCAHHRSQFAEALALYQRALSIAQNNGDTEASIEALNGCVAAYIKRRDYTNADLYAKKAVVLIDALDSDELRGDVFRSMGAVAFVRDVPHQAIEHFSHALRHYNNAHAHRKSGIMHFNIGLSYKQLSNYPQTLEYLHRSLEIAQKHKDSENIALSLIRLCSTYTDLGDYNSALDTSQRGYGYARKRGIRHIMIPALEQRGIAFSSKGEYTKALECYEESLRLRDEMHDINGRNMTLGNMAAVYAKLGEYEKALKVHDEILGASEERGDKQGKAAALVNISDVQNEMGNYQSALTNAQQSLALFESMGDKRGIGSALYSMGNTFVHTQRYAESMSYFMQALAVFRETGFLWGQSSVLTSLAKAVFDAIGKEASASMSAAGVWLQDALVIAQDINAKEQVAAIYKSYAAWYEHSGNSVEAFRCFKEYHRLEKELRMEEAAKTISILESRLALEESERTTELHRSRAQDLQKQVEFKQKELTAMAVQISQQNDVMEKLRRRVEEFATTISPQHVKDELLTLLHKAQTSTGTQQMWSAFEQQFQQLHSSFQHTLASRYPALTETERRVCALIKLQLNTKQIASTLHISQRTAEHHRLSIRKKIGLDERGNLGSLLATIE